MRRNRWGGERKGGGLDGERKEGERKEIHNSAASDFFFHNCTYQLNCAFMVSLGTVRGEGGGGISAGEGKKGGEG